MKLRPAIYPGSFDPITYGHIDVVNRAAAMFPRLIILVARNPVKAPMFSDIDRIAMIREVFRGRKNITVDGFDGLLVDYARQTRATAIIRGLRAVSDFEYEFQMALMNRKLYRNIDTVFLAPDERYTYLNSSIVREVARLGGNIDDFVPPVVRKRLRALTR
jgi:pantetheine-phosphate adenylyltransferase